jgi:hypothetical protein
MPTPSPTGYSADNIEITIASGTAVIATDYGTSGDGFTSAHAQIAKLTWGDANNTYRVSEQYPAPIKIYGITGATFPISGTISGTGDFYVRTNPTIPLIIRGSTFGSDAPVSITGGIQGISNGFPVGVTGYVNILNTVQIYGISGATAIAVTGGRRLNSNTDSVTIVGNVGLSGGLALAAASNSVAVYGSDLGGKVLTRLYASDGTTLGISGDALKVAVTNSGFTFSVSLSSTVGVTNDGANSALRVEGRSGGVPMTIKGSLSGGAVEIGAYTAVPVGVSGTVEIDDTALITEIDSLKTNIGAVATNAGYALDILNLISTSGNGAKVNVGSITRPSRVIHGQKTVSTTPSILGSDSLRTGITIKSPNTNAVDIYVGNSLSVSSTTGYILSPGESIYLEVSTLGSLFIRTASSTATVSYIGT